MNQTASDDLNDYENLHQVRIIGKRLRYAMEVFAGCFAPPFREKLYPALEEMQTILGHANDSYVANQRLAALRDSLRKAAPAEWDQYRPGIEGLLHHHERRLLEQRQHFLNWWGLWQPYGNEFALRTRLEELRLDPGRDDPATQASRPTTPPDDARGSRLTRTGPLYDHRPREKNARRGADLTPRRSLYF